jgi:probable F420-dependent oxidoreductase
MTGSGSSSLGRVGIWSTGLRLGSPTESARAAATLDELGFRAIWLPGLGGNDDVLRVSEDILRSTTRAVVIPAVVAIWAATPEAAAAEHTRLRTTYGNRFVLGLGSSSAQVARELGGRTTFRPVADVAEYLDAIDRLDVPIPAAERLLGALGPKMAQLGARRTLGIHPFLVTPEYSARTRPLIGPDALLAPHVPVVFSTDVDHVRAAVRGFVAPFVGMPTYRSNLLRIGFDETDLVPGGSDRLIDAIAAWGDPDSIRTTLLAHLQAGADHVAVQVLGSQAEFPMSEWRELATLAASITGDEAAG